ncbi:MAG: pyruvate kinase [Clostridia bacterium]|nr:pyruvate kinase [Clostridia bacterium]
MRKTKIVCTLGPASTNEQELEAMLKAGMNVARFNFSHGDHESHQKSIELFRRVRDRMGIPAAVMLDTKGPEVRIKEIEGDCHAVELQKGALFTLTTREVPGNQNEVSVTYSALPQKVKAGNDILIDDGRIRLSVLDTTETDVLCKVVVGGLLQRRKSINIPYAHLDMPFLNDRDKADLMFGVKLDVDFVAASFVRSKEDVIAMRKFLDYHGGHDIKIIAKIENSEGVENFNEILQHADGIMVARGDMGVEIAFERLPGIQKKFIRRCYQSGKMVICATQMLESMIHAVTPTRAEITDVANAVFDGTSAVMLSGETAMGDHPALVVHTMVKIVEQAENDALELNAYGDIGYERAEEDITNAICDAACTTARDIGAKALIAVTKSGTTARRMSKFRPSQSIVAATPDIKSYHQLALSWGVFPVLARDQYDTDALFLHAIDCAKQIDAVKSGDIVVISAGVPLNLEGMTNLLKVQTVK